MPGFPIEGHVYVWGEAPHESHGVWNKPLLHCKVPDPFLRKGVAHETRKVSCSTVFWLGGKACRSDDYGAGGSLQKSWGWGVGQCAPYLENSRVKPERLSFYQRSDFDMYQPGWIHAVYRLHRTFEKETNTL